jgi:hypothetical protein
MSNDLNKLINNNDCDEDSDDDIEDCDYRPENDVLSGEQLIQYIVKYIVI